MPSKLLIAAAEAAHAVDAAARSAFTSTAACASTGATVMARVRRERDRFVGFVARVRRRSSRRERIRGHARFVDAHHAAGRRPRASGHERRHRHRLARRLSAASEALGDRLVNDDVFEWTDLPSPSR